MSRTYWVYILASRRNGTLYVGMTNDLARRVMEHREGLVPGFTKRYGVKMLVHSEVYEDVNAAIHREKRLKNGSGNGRSISFNRGIWNGSIWPKP